jgi:hypothetical protein
VRLHDLPMLEIQIHGQIAVATPGQIARQLRQCGEKIAAARKQQAPRLDTQRSAELTRFAKITCHTQRDARAAPHPVRQEHEAGYAPFVIRSPKRRAAYLHTIELVRAATRVRQP